MASSLSVQEAADRLAVSPRRVRSMIAEGILPAERVGRAYLIDRSEVERVARKDRPHGRPLNAANAWALLALLDGRGDRARGRPSSSYHRVVSLKARSSEVVSAELRRSEPRAEVHRWRVLPRDLDRLMEDERVVRSGLSAEAPVIDVPFVPGRDGLDAYVSSDDFKALARRLHPIDDADGWNAQLRIPRGADWILHERVAPSAVVAADLLDHPDPRVARAAQRAFRELVP